MSNEASDLLRINAKVLLVDDEPEQRQVRAQLIKEFCPNVVEVGDVKAAMKCVAECVQNDVPIILLLDLYLVKGDNSLSMEFVETIAKNHWISDGYCGVIVMSAYASAEEKYKLFANSALGVVWDKRTMPLTDLNLLLAICNQDLNTRRTRRHDSILPEDVLGNSAALRQAYASAAKVANLETHGEIPVIFIQGESGTGKDSLAQFIHNKSSRMKRRFARLNCGGFRANPQLFEAAIFGQIAGIVGGAARRVGALEYAGDGTLFLDDLQELPMDAQSVLLQALTTKTYQVMGEPGSKPWQAALIVAYNKDPNLAIGKDLQAQLYYRIVENKICLPNLSDRGDDVLIAAAQIAGKFWGQYYPRRNIPTGCLSDEVQGHLRSLKYRTGNFRELGEIVRDACRHADGEGRTNLLLEDFVSPDAMPRDIPLRDAYEVMAIQEADKTTRTRDEAAAKFGVGRSQYYRLRKDYH